MQHLIEASLTESSSAEGQTRVPWKRWKGSARQSRHYFGSAEERPGSLEQDGG